MYKFDHVSLFKHCLCFPSQIPNSKHSSIDPGVEPSYTHSFQINFGPSWISQTTGEGKENQSVNSCHFKYFCTSLFGTKRFIDIVVFLL